RPRAAAPVDRWRHAELRHRALVEAAARRVAGVEDRLGDVAGAAQASLHLAEPARLRVFARRHADEPLEIPLEVIRAAAETSCQRRQRRMALDARQICARAADLFDTGIVP